MTSARPNHVAVQIRAKDYDKIRAVAAEDGQKYNEVISRAVELYLSWRSSQRSATALPYRIPADASAAAVEHEATR